MRSNHAITIIIACLLATTCLARPPKVIKMYPENGAVDVKPGLVKIRILFDQDMGRGSSLCGGGKNFPDIVGEPKWTSRRAFVFSARLEPGHDYTFGINSRSFKNFKSVSGEATEILVVKFRTASGNEGNSEIISQIIKNKSQVNGCPKVIKTIPQKGDRTVPPGPTKFTILFDQDMSTGGMSICNTQFKFPDIVGKPKWAGKRALVFNAKLEPNCEYGFSINCPTAKNFKSARGEPAEIYFVTFKTTDGKETPAKQTTTSLSENKAAVKNLREAIDHRYSYRSLKDVDWNGVFGKYNKSLLNAKSAEEFADTASTVLAHAKDKHIWLMVRGQRVSCYINPVTPNANLQLLPKLVPNFQKHNANVCTGKFPDGVGYIYIDSWNSQQRQDYDQLYIALNEFSDAPGLIIDVRGNGGGAEPLAQEFAGCFINKPKLYAKHVYKDAKSPNGFGSIHERILQPNKSCPQYRGKITVLTGPVVMSSCEAFVLMMKQVPNCKIVGETTRGSSGNPKPHDLGNGVTVYLPSWKALLPDGTCFESKGIRPDIQVKVRPDQITTKDPVIEAALKELKRSR